MITQHVYNQECMSEQGTQLHSDRLTTIDTDHFAQRPYVLVRRLITAALAGQFATDAGHWQSRRVVCGSSVEWTEHYVPECSNLYKLFCSRALVTTLHHLSGVPSSLYSLMLLCWVSHYRLGEYITAHRDQSGDIQVVLGLVCPPKHNGGCLSFSYGSDRAGVCLTSGDAVVFKATDVTHSTTPLISTRWCTSPERVVAVARYSFLNTSHPS